MERRAQAAESLLAKATGQEALEQAIRAAELYMRAAAEETVTKAEAARLRRRCHELIAHAEQLKANLRTPPAAASGQTAVQLSSSSPSSSTSSAGLDILRQASRLHGNDYPPWTSGPSDAEFQLGPGAEAFTDNYVFKLSSTQAANFAAWSRPHELFDLSLAGQDDNGFMQLKKKCDLVQDVTTDCSVVASLSAAAGILTGKHSVLSTIIYPFDHAKGQPKLSPSGKYVLRMNFNGCARRVVIDDRLPASRTNRALFVVDRQNPCLVWPALLEKAYLKVRGGYDFPGSNSGTDLWVLTGWIPEQLFLQSEDFDVDKTWERIKTAYDMQDVVVTLGTGRISAEEEQLMGLVGEHDYAVQEIDSTGGIRRLLVKNPWSQGPSWTGAGWSAPRQPIKAIPASLPSQEGGDGAQSPPSGALWLTMEDVAQHFESMYLNWNPALFTHRRDHHFTWTIPPKNVSASLVRNPQFSLHLPGGGLIWVLVSRHFVDAELEIARNKSGSMAAVARRLGFMSILVFENDGRRVQVSDGQAYRGPYVDSPQTLARVDTRPGGRYTIVVDQQELPLEKYTLTLSIFSHAPVEIKEAEERMTHYTEHSAVWNRRTAGGNSSCSTYFLNPQYKLSVSQASPISILLSTDSRDVHVHVDLVWGRGERAKTVRVKDLVGSSGEYRRGCAVADIPKLEAGTYTLVCSTFEAGQMASFALRVASMTAVSLQPVPADAAGRLRTALSPFTFGGGGERWRAALSVSWLTRASVYVRSVAPRPGSRLTEGRPPPSFMVRISIIHGRGPERTIVAESGGGEFQDSTTAIQTPEFDIEPGRAGHEGVWLVIESIGGPHAAQAISGEIFSDSPVNVGPWGAQ